MKTSKTKASLNQNQKYAFNINEMKVTKNFKGSVGEFQKLKCGLYDEIESKDILIKENKDQLQKIKNSSLKEFVYSNKDIPDLWKTKLDYQPNLLKLFTNDKHFLFYLGHGGDSNKYKNTYMKTDINIQNSAIKKNFNNSKISRQNNFYSKLGSNINKQNQENIENNIKKQASIYNHTSKFNSFKGHNNINEKEIATILEDFRNTYPIILKNQENFSSKENNNESKKIEEIKSDRRSRTFYGSNAFPSFAKNKKQKRNFSLDIIGGNYSFPQKMKYMKRQNTFRQNIFTNLLPSSNDKSLLKIGNNKFDKFSRTCTNFNKKPKTRIPTLPASAKNNNHAFLGSDIDSFNKKINIDNPVIKKYLEGINFYGPYFSFCPPCGNRNLEFFKNLEPNQCLSIIQQIKKQKGKQLIMKRKKKLSKRNEKLSNKQILNANENKNIGIDNGNNNFNENISEKCNYSDEGYDMENTSIKGNFSIDSMGNENYDMFE